MKHSNQKVKLSAAKRGRPTGAKNKHKDRSLSKTNRNVTNSAKKSVNKAEKKGKAVQSGESRITRSRGATPKKETHSRGTTPKKNQSEKKSPQVVKVSEKKNSKARIAKKNAPNTESTRKQKKGKRVQPKKEIQIVLESPKVKATPGRTPVKKASNFKSDRTTRSAQSVVSKKDLDSASKLISSGKKRVQKSAKKQQTKVRGGKGKSDFQILINTPKSAKSNKSRSRSSPKKESHPTHSRGQTPSKAKQRMKMLAASDDEDEFMKTVKKTATPSKKDTRSKSKGKSKTPVKAATKPTTKTRATKNIKPVHQAKQIKQEATPEIIKPRKETKVATRGGRKPINEKALDQAMHTLDKVRLTPKKSSPIKKPITKTSKTKTRPLAKSESKSVSPVKERERSRNKEETPSKSPSQKKYFLNSASRKAAGKTDQSISSSRTPTKKFQKDKTPESSESSEEEAEKKKPLFRKKVIEPKQFASAVKSNIKPVIKKDMKVKEEVEEDSEEEKEVSSSSSETRRNRHAGIKGQIVKRPVKHQLSYKADTKGISDEISKILAKIEERKKQKLPIKSAKKGLPRRARLTKKKSAKDYNFKLQRNPNIKAEHIVKISDLESKSSITNSDILLAILEIASNADYYMITFSNNSRFFWIDVLQYPELERIFQGFSGETLRKYWRFMTSIADVNKISDLVKRHKKLLDENNVKLLPVVNALKGYFSGEEESFEKAVQNQTTTTKTKQVKTEDMIDPKTGEKISVKTTVLTRSIKKKYATGAAEDQKQWNGKNYQGKIDIYEATDVSTPVTEGFAGFQNILSKEDKKKFEYLNEVKHEEKVKILNHTEDHKFVYTVIDNILEELKDSWPMYPKSYLSNVLANCSFNLEHAILYLLDPMNKADFIFNDINDNVIVNLKETDQFKLLVNQKGSDLVQLRDDYINTTYED